MSSIGESLRSERLRRGLSLDEIADQTKISPRHLQAIESDDFEKLPGSFFARSFIRQYAKALDFDERELESELDSLTEPAAPLQFPPREPARHQLNVAPIKSDSRRGLGERFSFGSVVGFVVVVLACSGLYTVWQRHRTPEPIRESASAAARKEAVPVWKQATQTGKTPESPAAAAQPAAVRPGTEQAPPARAQVTELPPAGNSAAVPPDARIRLDLGATEDTWVRVTSDQKVVFTGILKPGQTRSFHGVSSMAVRTGNAGGLQVGWNGKPIGPIGPKGQIRVIEFTPEGHKVLPSNPPANPIPDIF